LKVSRVSLTGKVVIYQHSKVPSAYNILKVPGAIKVRCSKSFAKKFPLAICGRSIILRTLKDGTKLKLSGVTEDGLRNAYLFLSHGLIELELGTDEEIDFLDAARQLKIIGFDVSKFYLNNY
jgi:hypothetical protein